MAAKKGTKKVKAKVAKAAPKLGLSNGRMPHGVERVGVFVQWEKAKLPAVKEAASAAGLTYSAYIRGAVHAAVEGKLYNARKAKKAFVDAQAAA